jgi:hypothetical protein
MCAGAGRRSQAVPLIRAGVRERALRRDLGCLAAPHLTAARPLPRDHNRAHTLIDAARDLPERWAGLPGAVVVVRRPQGACRGHPRQLRAGRGPGTRSQRSIRGASHHVAVGGDPDRITGLEAWL